MPGDSTVIEALSQKAAYPYPVEHVEVSVRFWHDRPSPSTFRTGISDAGIANDIPRFVFSPFFAMARDLL